MPPLPLPLAMQSDPGRGALAGVARLVNCYVEKTRQGRAEFPIWACDGLNDFATLTGGGATRAMLDLDSSLYVVSDRTLFGVDGAGTVTSIGGIPSDGLVTMARNRQRPNAQIGIVCDGLYWILQNNVLTAISDPDLSPPNSICFVGGYFVLTTPDGRYFLTSIDEGTAIDALDFASAEANPDGLVRGMNYNGEIALIGPRSTEFHQNTGDATFPFARTAAKSYGCLSAKSVADVSIITEDRVSETLAWVATNSQGEPTGAIMLEGYEPRKISTPGLERLIRDDPSRTEIDGTSWVSGGHGFYSLTGTDWSWVYDTATGLWHERESWQSAQWKINAVRAFAGRIIAGDRTAGKLYVMDPDAYTESGDPLIVTVQSSPVHAFPERIEMGTLHLSAMTGVGLVTGASQDTDPHIMMQWSEDGANWSAERWRSLGTAAQTAKDVRWNGLGTQRPQGRSYRFSASAAVLKGIFEASFIDWKKVRA